MNSENSDGSGPKNETKRDISGSQAGPDMLEDEIREKTDYYFEHLGAVQHSLHTWKSPHDTVSERMWRMVTADKLNDFILNDVWGHVKYWFASETSADELLMACDLLEKAGSGMRLSQLVDHIDEEYGDEGLGMFYVLLSAGLLDYAYVMPPFRNEAIIGMLQNRAIQVDEAFASSTVPGKITAVILYREGDRIGMEFDGALRELEGTDVAVRRIDTGKPDMDEWQRRLGLGCWPTVVVFNSVGEPVSTVSCMENMPEQAVAAVVRAEESERKRAW